MLISLKHFPKAFSKRHQRDAFRAATSNCTRCLVCLTLFNHDCLAQTNLIDSSHVHLTTCEAHVCNNSIRCVT